MYNDARENQGVKPSTLEARHTHQRVLIDLIGADTPISSLDRNVGRIVLDNLVLQPVNAFKKYPEKGLLEIIDITRGDEEIERLSNKSINGYLEHLGAITNWANDNDYSMPNIVKGMKLPEGNAKEKRNPFTADQLNTLFSEKGVLQFKDIKSASYKYWIPLIGLLTGMRIGEICTLNPSDIRKEKEHWYIDINIDDEGKSVKTPQSIRRVPVSNLLMKAGFIEYVEEVRTEDRTNRKIGRLFPYYNLGKKKPADPFSKAFARILKKVGIKTKKTTFHSFRHYYQDVARETEGIDRTVTDVIGGWSEGKGSKVNYGSDYSLKRLSETMNKLEFVGIQHLEGLIRR